MPMFLETRSRRPMSIGICARCSCKYPLEELSPDPNYPGLMCCPDGCLDQLDPWRLAPRETENITLAFARPDVAIDGYGSTPVYTNQIQVVTSVPPPIVAADSTGAPIAIAPPLTGISKNTTPWAANQSYPEGATVTPGVIVGLTATESMSKVYVCLVPGLSGAVAPDWNPADGSLMLDNEVVWLNSGWYIQ